MKENKMDQDMLDSFKSDYQNIPVPEEARNRVLMGIQQAKKERKVRVIRLFTARTAATAAAALAAITVLANSGPAVALAMEQIPIIGAIAEVVTFRTYQSKEGNFEANLEIPEITVSAEGGDETTQSIVPANQEIEKYAEELRRRNMKKIMKYGIAFCRKECKVVLA